MSKLILALEVFAPPVAQGRPRVGKGGHVYTPKKSRSYRELLTLEAKCVYGDRPPTEQLCTLFVSVHTQAPKSLHKSVKSRINAGESLPSGKRPDADNYLKMVMDALNGVVVVDDSQFWSAGCSKYISNTPRIEVLVLESQGGNDD